MAKRKAGLKSTSSRSRATGSSVTRSTANRRRATAKKTTPRPARVTTVLRETVRAEHAEVMAQIARVAQGHGLDVTEVHFAAATTRAGQCPPGHARILVRTRDEHGTLIVVPRCVPVR